MAIDLLASCLLGPSGDDLGEDFGSDFEGGACASTATGRHSSAQTIDDHIMIAAS
jgi:hypothetical protein